MQGRTIVAHTLTSFNCMARSFSPSTTSRGLVLRSADQTFRITAKQFKPKTCK